MKDLFFLSLTLILLVSLFGCPKRSALSSITALSSPPPPGSEVIIRLLDGEKISFRQLLEDLLEVSVIFTGESHDQMEHHQIQRKIIQGLAEKGKEVVIAMEMFQRSQQPILDRWTQGFLSEEEFLRQVEWETTWGMNYQLYQGILDEAKARRLKVLALNVPRELVRKIAQRGIEGLPEEDRKRFPEMDLHNHSHRSYIKTIYKGHEGGLAGDFERFYQAQVLWDEGMAETLSDFLSSSEGKGKTVLVLAGAGHVIYRFGIPERFYRRSPIPYKTILLKEWKKKIEEESLFHQRSIPPADYLWITPPSPPEKRRPRIGIVLKEKGPSSVWIERILRDSPAEKAGLVPGDQILRVDGKEIQTLRDLHEAVARKELGKGILFTILREDEVKEILVNPQP